MAPSKKCVKTKVDKSAAKEVVAIAASKLKGKQTVINRVITRQSSETAVTGRNNNATVVNTVTNSQDNSIDLIEFPRSKRTGHECKNVTSGKQIQTKNRELNKACKSLDYTTNLAKQKSYRVDNEISFNSVSGQTNANEDQQEASTSRGNELDDGIVVTVHAPEDVFESDSEDEMSDANADNEGSSSEYDEDDNPEVETPPRNTTRVVERSTPQQKPLPTPAEYAAMMAEDPEFQEQMQLIIDRRVQDTLKEKKDQDTRGHGTPPSRNKGKAQEVLKSPSDTIIYAPALAKGNRTADETDGTIDKMISQFVENIKLASLSKGSEGDNLITMDKQCAPSIEGNDETSQPQRQGKSAAAERGKDERNGLGDNIILDAEKYKAQLLAPKGNTNQKVDHALSIVGVEKQILDQDDPFNAEQFERLKRDDVEFRRFFDNDDDFFHVTCHLDASFKHKIIKGDFIDLERLLPKERGGFGLLSNDCKLEWISKDGSTYLAPAAAKESKINGIRKWEQAFCIYAAVYTNAHPERASEIWQYVYTINSAALSYQWDNVALYNFTFRQLMAEKPWRSWAMTYTQGWNLTLKEPINSRSTNNNMSNSGGAHGLTRNTSKDWRDDCCWRFNRNRCNRGRACGYDHRCTYCGGWGHGFFNCRKRKRNGERGSPKRSPRRNDEKHVLDRNKTGN